MLMNCKRVERSITSYKYEHSGNMQSNVLCFINNVNDHWHFPTARCAMRPRICMFHSRTSSSSVESTNWANGMVHESTAVDPINSLILLVHLAKRCAEHQNKVWNWSKDLTPLGKKLIQPPFEKVNIHYFGIYVTPEGDRYCCPVNCLTLSNKYICYFPMMEEDGSLFAECTCGALTVDGIQCQHTFAVCKSKKIAGLPQQNKCNACMVAYQLLE